MADTKVNLKDYSDSFDIIISTPELNDDFNLVNNDYMDVQAFLFTLENQIYTSKQLSLKPCEDSDLKKFTPKFTTNQFKNAICFDKTQNITLQGNYRINSKAAYLKFRFVACTGKSTCKSPQETEQFARNTVFMLQTVQAEFAYDVYSDSFDPPKEDYMPTVIVPRFHHYGPFNQYRAGSKLHTGVGFELSVDEYIIEDSKWNVPGLATARDKKFLAILDKTTFEMSNGGEPVIHAFNFDLSLKSREYQRTVKSYVGALSDSGGLFDILLIIFMTVYSVVAKPFEKLNVLLKFYELQVGEDRAHSERSLFFLMRYWLYEHFISPFTQHCT